RGWVVAVRGGDSGRAPGPSRGSPQLRRALGPPPRLGLAVGGDGGSLGAWPRRAPSSRLRTGADMGTARREIYTFSPGFSRASESSPDAAGTAALFRARAPISARTHSREPCPSQRKENSSRGPRRLL